MVSALAEMALKQGSVASLFKSCQLGRSSNASCSILAVMKETRQPPSVSFHSDGGDTGDT